MPSKRELYLKHIAKTSDSFMGFQVEKAEGIYLYDEDDRPCIDLISGIAVSALGHGHPAVIDAVKEQSKRFMHTMVYGEHIQQPQVRLAELLTSQLPPEMDSVYFVNSGSEAVEGALKLARKHTERPEVVAARNAYHGSTQGAAALMSDTRFTQAYRPGVPGSRFIDFNDRGDLNRISRKTACVIVEPVQGEGGCIVPELEYMHALRRRCDEVGALLIFDEIQTGYGRTGKLFAFEHFGIAPDIICLAKGMGGGMPLGAFVAADEIMKSLASNPILGHITTFGGHPVCCAAGYACLEALVKGEIIEHVQWKGKQFRERLQGHDAIQSISGLGLMLAVELESPEAVQSLIEATYERGILLDWFLFREERFRITPPLIISREEIDKVCDLLIESLDKI